MNVCLAPFYFILFYYSNDYEFDTLEIFCLRLNVIYVCVCLFMNLGSVSKQLVPWWLAPMLLLNTTMIWSTVRA